LAEPARVRLWGEGAEGTGHGRDDGEEDEGWEEAEDEGERESNGRSAGVRLGSEAGAAAEGFRPGGQRLRRRGTPALGGLQRGGRRAQLVESGALGGRAERRRRGPPEAEDGGGKPKVLAQDLRGPFGDPEHSLVGIEAGEQGGAEEVKDRRSHVPPVRQPPVGRAPPHDPHPDQPGARGERDGKAEGRHARGQDAKAEACAHPEGHPVQTPTSSYTSPRPCGRVEAARHFGDPVETA
jgi:hypothetical protein